MDNDLHGSEANVLDGEQNLVGDVLVMLMVLNRSLLGAHDLRFHFLQSVNVHITDHVSLFN